MSSDPPKPKTRPRVWVDADAAPKACKQVLLKAANRRGVEVILVANSWQQKPKSRLVTTIQVPTGADVADDYIAEHCGPADLVITADVPLAARAVENGAIVLQPRGRELDTENVKEQLDIRNFNQDLRDSGVMTGGPAPYGTAEKQRFSNALDRWITLRLRDLEAEPAQGT